MLARIAPVLLGLSLSTLAACPGGGSPDDGGAPGTTGADASSTGGTSTAATDATPETPVWPPVACGDKTCAMGEVCVFEGPSCSLISDPCASEETGETGEEPGQCWVENSDPPVCRPFLPACEGASDLGACLGEQYCSSTCDEHGFSAGALDCGAPCHDPCAFEEPMCAC